MAGQSSSPDSPMPADTAGTGAWIGKTISHRYQIDSLLGAGGMGFVYRAIDTNLDTHVVLKVPKRILLENPVFTERFVREIRALVSLSHPHVVKILDVGKHEDVPFAVMQYLPGGDLNDRRQGNGKSYVPMPVRIAMGDWLRQVAGAIDFVHDRGFVHRDIKPGNIIFDTYGNAYLGDFGVAKVVTETQSNNDLDALTGEGLVLGTMDYMAPELAKGGKITSAVDQYALAVTIFEILAGRKPFVGRTKELALVARLTMVAPNIQTVFRDVPELMAVVIAKGLAIKPLDRYPNCSQFAEALLAAIPLGEMSEDRSVPASAKLACPSCNAVLTAKAFVIGKSIPCPKCRESIVADDRLTHLMKSVDAAELLKVRTSTVDEKSLVKLPCPKCETVMKIGPEAAGRNAPCPSCGIKLRIAIDRRSLQEVFPSSQVGSETPDSAQETVQGKFPVGATAFDVQKQKRESTPVAVPIAVPKIIHSLAPRQPFPDSSSNSSFDNSEYINDILPEFNRSTPLDFSTKRILRFALAGAVLFVVMIICIEAWKLYQKFENTMDEGAPPAKSSVPKPLVPPKPVDSSSIDQKKSATSIVPVPGSAQRADETKLQKATNSIGMKFVEIPTGEFMMGEGNDAVAVTLERPFLLGKYEVTQGQWKKVMNLEPWAGQGGVQIGDDNAASYVNCDDATNFCKKLTAIERKTGKLKANEEYRLPTEAEWEYACRAGTKTEFSFGDDELKLGEYAWFKGNADDVDEKYTHKVGVKMPNPWGLHDMHGNVWEWCSDWHGDALSGGTDPVGPNVGSLRVIRGGGWGYDPGSCRSANHDSGDPSARNDYLGFRVARSQSAQ
ncbi:MAG: hypothetical protein D4R77_07910 [Planctomycetaceae bacterium]|nr:MAG: hypothetical protein D4R77_07910 [Planctomycetaceae bacterium]